MTKGIVLCADDYGQDSSISEAIIALIQKERLSATSCLVNSIHWPTHASWLKPFRHRIDIGLHFNLTEGKALSQEFIDRYGSDLFSLKSLMVRSVLLRRLKVAVIAAELNAQLDQFLAIMGELPDFIDGHQHVHQFPIVREALLKIYQTRLLTKMPYIRSLETHGKNFHLFHHFKNVMIRFSGMTQLKKLLQQYNIPHNATFSGIYPFSTQINYREHFMRCLSEVKDGGLIMCHPGGVGVESRTVDRIHAARQMEYGYLGSAEFAIDCQNNKIKLKRFSG